MRPVINQGDIILVAGVTDPASLKNGAIVTFNDPVDGLPTMHRVVGRMPTGELQTRGDANARPDSSPVPLSEVTGQAKLLVPLIGTPLFWIEQEEWLPLGAAIGVFLLMSAGLVWGLSASGEAMPSAPKQEPAHESLFGPEGGFAPPAAAGLSAPRQRPALESLLELETASFGRIFAAFGVVIILLSLALTHAAPNFSLVRSALASATDNTGNSLTAAASFCTGSSTGWLSPTSTGDDYTDWSNPTNAFASDNTDATEDRNGQKQDWYDFAFDLSGCSSIDGIEVEIEASDPFCDEGNGAEVEISWDGGASYTSTGKDFTGICTTDIVHTLGGSADTWGRTWTAAELGDANFRIRLSKIGFDWDPTDLDHIQIKVHYTP